MKVGDLVVLSCPEVGMTGRVLHHIQSTINGVRESGGRWEVAFDKGSLYVLEREITVVDGPALALMFTYGDRVVITSDNSPVSQGLQVGMTGTATFIGTAAIGVTLDISGQVVYCTPKQLARIPGA